MVEPDDIRAGLVGVLDGEVDELVSRGCAVPVELVGFDPDGVAGVDELGGLAFELDPAEAGDDVQCLAERVAVPGGAGAGLEGDACGFEAGRGFGVGERLKPDCAGEPGGWALATGDGFRFQDFHLRRFY